MFMTVKALLVYGACSEAANAFRAPAARIRKRGTRWRMA
jgi:hypothetical protein